MSVTRWRLSAWTDNRPDKAYRKYHSTACKLCAIAAAIAWAKANREGLGWRETETHWAIGRLSGHLGQYDIVFHDGMNLGKRVAEHAHRQSISGDVGTAKRP